MHDKDPQVEAHLFTRAVEVHERFDWPATGEFVVHSERSPIKASDNEDGALVLHLGAGRAVVAVADGVGGHPAGAKAAASALEALQSTIEAQLLAGDPLREAILCGFDNANQAVLDIGSGSATTLAAIEIQGARVRAYHVGDSRVLAFGGRGKLKLGTISHSPVGYAQEAGWITEDAARVHDDRHIVSNVVGTPEMHISISPPLCLSPRDTVLLASDGLFDNIAVSDAVKTLQAKRISSAVKRMARRCRSKMEEGGHPDDLTVVAFRAPDCAT